MNLPTDAKLLLQDGTVINGYAHGASAIAMGELCFNTGMAGYQEIFTDPSYFGQIILMTHSHIGNYGTFGQEEESGQIQIRAMVCRNFSRTFSRAGSTTSLQDYLSQHGVPAISGIDTRALVRLIRTKGAMNALVCTDRTPTGHLMQMLERCPSMDGLELANQVTTTQINELKPDGEVKYTIGVYDYGIKRSMLQSFLKRGCAVKVFPSTCPVSELLAEGIDGYLLSNGPGDPAAMPYALNATIALLSTHKPVFGICLGHQLLAQAHGLKTYKMRFGHRGLNHAVKNLITGKAEITSQNHGFAVSAEQIDQNGEVEITHINLNDRTVEGLRYRHRPAFSVQYHPESSPGPQDSGYLFDDFITMLDKSGK